MAYSRRSYKGAPVSNALGGSTLAADATSITLASAMSGWSTSGTPFFIVVDPGTTKEEKICVIYNTSTSLTVVDPAVTSGWTASVNGRGCDDTTPQQHSAGATIYPVFTASEANQANELVSKYTTNGDIVVHGSTGLKTIGTGGSGNNNKVLIADSTVSDGGVKWGTVDTAGITDSAITAAKIASAVAGSGLAGGSGTALSVNVDASTIEINSDTLRIKDAGVTLAKLASAVANALVPVGTITAYAGATAPTGWLLCDGTSTTGYTSLAALVGATTPDLRGRFLIGDNASLTLLATGGSSIIGTNNLPAHSHANTAALASGTVSFTDSGHTHGSGSTGTTDISHTHPLSGRQTGSTSHTHQATTTIAMGIVGGTAVTPDTESAGGSHSHTIASATTGITGSVGTTVNMTNADTGGGEAYYPPYGVVNYIIKHD